MYFLKPVTIAIAFSSFIEFCFPARPPQTSVSVNPYALLDSSPIDSSFFDRWSNIRSLFGIHTNGVFSLLGIPVPLSRSKNMRRWLQKSHKFLYVFFHILFVVSGPVIQTKHFDGCSNDALYYTVVITRYCTIRKCAWNTIPKSKYFTTCVGIRSFTKEKLFFKWLFSVQSSRESQISTQAIWSLLNIEDYCLSHMSLNISKSIKCVFVFHFFTISNGPHE